MHDILLLIQRGISLAGVLVILSGVLFALYHYAKFLIKHPSHSESATINMIRLNFRPKISAWLRIYCCSRPYRHHYHP